ncbi:hypothetical protein GGS20DRAFT_537299 [Poronia punctata]|nr:hypothetical protein GGS20DRAFT_537299 [Poronia punctata]
MRWLLRRVSRSKVYALQPKVKTRLLSTFPRSVDNAERVNVPVGSSGSVDIDLYNLAKVSSSDPLLVYLPSFSNASSSRGLSPLPSSFSRKLTTAVINYRWTDVSSPDSPVGDDASEADGLVHRPFHPGWPTPLSDTLTAYTWLVENLAPAADVRRDVYVYGSYLGATLATTLALTEAYPEHQMAVRGCVAYNGIYNWTMFLPDHPINKLTSSGQNMIDEILAPPGDPEFHQLKRMTKELFTTPQDLFDPFASPCLFFHAPNLLVPPSFDASAIPSGSPAVSPDLSWFSEEEDELPESLYYPRKSPLAYPPRESTLKIPDVLLLYDKTPDLPSPSTRGRGRPKRNKPKNDFQIQAEELASLMRRSVNKYELKERTQWDEDNDYEDGEAERRIHVHDVGQTGQESEVAVAWLEERISEKA